MKSYVPTKIATFIYAGVMAIFGIMHFMSGADMGGMVPIPGGVIWVYVTGVALIAYAVAVFMNHKYEKMAGYLLALLLVIFILTIHVPNMMGGDHMSMITIMKDLALAAAAIVMANHSDMT